MPSRCASTTKMNDLGSLGEALRDGSPVMGTVDAIASELEAPLEQLGA